MTTVQAIGEHWFGIAVVRVAIADALQTIRRVRLTWIAVLSVTCFACPAVGAAVMLISGATIKVVVTGESAGAFVDAIWWTILLGPEVGLAAGMFAVGALWALRGPR